MLYKSKDITSILHFIVVIKMSSYENHVVKLLNKEKIKYQREKTFSDLKGGKYRFDFYLPNYNGQAIIIEVDGE